MGFHSAVRLGLTPRIETLRASVVSAPINTSASICPQHREAILAHMKEDDERTTRR